jgi:Zn finger protein HypA/HybF involved in hydrogenase expression
MPTAECRCNACDHSFTHLTFKGDDTPPFCPRCKGRDIQVKTDPEGFMGGPGLGSLIVGVPKGPS